MTSYAAGRRAQLLDPDLVERRPFWRYVHNDSVTHPRPQHKRWGDMKLTLRHDHPFWETHFPPNGWGCKCRVVAVAAPGDGDVTEPPEGWAQTDPATGAPVGIDEGWGYAPGARSDSELRSFVQDKLIDYPPAIERMLSVDVNRHLNTTERITDFVQRVRDGSLRNEDLWMGFVEPEAAARIKAATGQDVDSYMVLLPEDNVRHTYREHRWDGKGQRPVEPADYEHVASFINEANETLPGTDVGRHGEARVLVRREIDGEVFRAVFEILHGKRNRALKLISLAIKTAQK